MFLARFGAPGAVTHELFGDEVAAARQRAQLRPRPAADLRSRRTRAMSSRSAPTSSGTWNSPVSNAQGYGQMRQGRAGIRGSFVQVESRMSQTGANADEWVPARPGTEGVLALGLAHVIIAAKLRPASGARPRRRADRGLERGPRRLLARAGGKDHRRRGSTRRASRARVRRAPSRCRHHRRRTAGAHQRPVQRAGRECPQRARRQRRAAGRHARSRRSSTIARPRAAGFRLSLRKGDGASHRRGAGRC